MLDFALRALLKATTAAIVAAGLQHSSSIKAKYTARRAAVTRRETENGMLMEVLNSARGLKVGTKVWTNRDNDLTLAVLAESPILGESQLPPFHRTAFDNDHEDG